VSGEIIVVRETGTDEDTSYLDYCSNKGIWIIFHTLHIHWVKVDVGGKYSRVRARGELIPKGPSQCLNIGCLRIGARGRLRAFFVKVKTDGSLQLVTRSAGLGLVFS